MTQDRIADENKALLHKPDAEPSEPMRSENDSVLDASGLRRLQQQIGNRAVQRLLSGQGTTSDRVPHAITLSSIQRDDTKAEVVVKPAVEAVGEEDRAEFDLLKRKIEDPDAAAYVKHRTELFGSTEQYEKFAVESDAELDGTKGLRKLIELEGDAQTVFYRWVRKAYQNAGAADVPGLIKRGKSPELNAALGMVKAGYGKPFSLGGFNPRPMKSARYKYRLGTISEHALGKAADVDD